MYTRAKLTDEEGKEKEILTFGPLAIAKDHQSKAFEIDEKEAEEYDERFEKMEKQRQASQEEFYIISNSVLR